MGGGGGICMPMYVGTTKRPTGGKNAIMNDNLCTLPGTFCWCSLICSGFNLNSVVLQLVWKLFESFVENLK